MQTTSRPLGPADLRLSVRRPRPRTHREQAASLAHRVREHYAKYGSIPGDLRDRIVREEQCHRWGVGEPTPQYLVEKYVDEWIADLLRKDDAKRGVSRAVEVE